MMANAIGAAPSQAWQAKFNKEVSQYFESCFPATVKKYGEDYVKDIVEKIEEISKKLFSQIEKAIEERKNIQALTLFESYFVEKDFLKLLDAYLLEKYGLTLSYFEEITKMHNHSLYPSLHKSYFSGKRLTLSWSPRNPLLYQREKNIFQSKRLSYGAEKHSQREWRKAQAGEGTDVCFLAQEGEAAQNKMYCAHRAKLILHSKYFKRLFKGEFADKAQNQPIPIDQAGFFTFKAFLKFIYEGRLSKKLLNEHCPDEANIQRLVDLFNLASSYDVSKKGDSVSWLMRLCIQEILEWMKGKEIDQENFEALLDTGWRGKNKELVKACLELVENKTKRICLNKVLSEDNCGDLLGYATEFDFSSSKEIISQWATNRYLQKIETERKSKISL